MNTALTQEVQRTLFLTSLQKTARATEEYLQLFFDQQAGRLPASLPEAKRMVDTLRTFCLLGGKRLRPYLVGLGARLTGAGEDIPVVQLGAALELLHAFFLVHDDIMDKSRHRRGVATVHVRYEQEFLQAGQGLLVAQEYGVSLGILAGDLVLALMVRLLADLSLPWAVQSMVWRMVGDVLAQTIHGQELDVRFALDGDVEEESILDMYRLKTAQYSFVSPLLLGASLGRVSPVVKALLQEYGVTCGLAFQMQDDMLGVFGDEVQTGKEAGDDIRSGKRSLLLAKALRLASSQGRRALLAVMGEKECSSDDLERARAVVRESGALQECRLLAMQYAASARATGEHIRQEVGENPLCGELDELALFIINRSG